jgi:hypothetical protein
MIEEEQEADAWMGNIPDRAKPQWEVCRRVMVNRRRDSQAGARQVNESEEWLDEVTGVGGAASGWLRTVV